MTNHKRIQRFKRQIVDKKYKQGQRFEFVLPDQLSEYTKLTELATAYGARTKNDVHIITVWYPRNIKKLMA